MIHDFKHSLRGWENQSINQKMKSKHCCMDGMGWDGMGWDGASRLPNGSDRMHR
jgi:hypothetical protein